MVLGIERSSSALDSYSLPALYLSPFSFQRYSNRSFLFTCTISYGYVTAIIIGDKNCVCFARRYLKGSTMHLALCNIVCNYVGSCARKQKRGKTFYACCRFQCYLMQTPPFRTGNLLGVGQPRTGSANGMVNADCTDPAFSPSSEHINLDAHTFSTTDLDQPTVINTASAAVEGRRAMGEDSPL